MEYGEVLSLVKEIDNLDCADGAFVHFWYLDTQNEFNNMLNSVSHFDLRHSYGFQSEHEYESYLKSQISKCTYEEIRDLLNKHKELWFTLIQRSEPSNRYFTPDVVDLFKRITPLSKQEVYVQLNAYNFIPIKLLLEYQNDPMIELGSNKVLSCVIRWKQQLVERYFVVSRLQNRYVKRVTRDNDDLNWNLSDKQVKQLISLFRRHFQSSTETDVIVNILMGRQSGNIIWLATTESLVYFFRLLFQEQLIANKNWGLVISNRLMFVSKQGNIITNRNVNTSSSHLDRKNSTYTLKPEFKKIDSIINRFLIIAR